MVHADDLDDGLVYEVNDAQDDDVVSDGELVELDKDNDSNTADEVSENKRALDTEDNGNTLSTEESEKPLSKRQKKLANSSLHQKKLERMAYEKAQKENLPKASVDKIIEYLATSIRDKNPDLSALELDELYFKKQDFLSTEKYEKDRSLNNFQDFIHTFSKSPRSIILSQSNIRVADVYRSVNGHQTAVSYTHLDVYKRQIHQYQIHQSKIAFFWGTVESSHSWT